jgi:outer membrane protein OmpA-like peptidoglycan-associated protein
MGSQDDDNIGVVLGVVFGVIALVIALVIGVSMYQTNLMAAKPVPALAAVTSAADGASIKVEGGVVKFYFASGKSEVAAGANQALADVVKAVATGKKVVISGFHDSTGDSAMNAELAKQRAFAVRDALAAMGVAQDKIELKKPENTQMGGVDSEARRVEVAVQ